MNTADASTTSQPWDKLGSELRSILMEVYRCVHERLVPRGLGRSDEVKAPPTGELLLRVRQCLRGPFAVDAIGYADVRPIVVRLLQIADQLMRTADDPPLYASFESWTRDPGKARPAGNTGDAAVPPTEGTLIELLTGVWLGLYFLSTPFVHPWEKALRIAEGSGGFPGGACLSKAIGDLYRLSRQAGIRDFGRFKDMATAPKCIACAGVLVLDLYPLSLNERLFKPGSENASRTLADVLIAISTCYELLQLRLYVEEGLPITYILPFKAIGEATDPKAPEAAEGRRVKMWLALASVFPNDRSGVAWTFRQEKRGDSVIQRVLIVESEMKSVPQCVLGHQIGVQGVRLDPGSQEDSQNRGTIAGTYVARNLLESYRKELSSVQGEEVLTMTKDRFLSLKPQARTS